MTLSELLTVTGHHAEYLTGGGVRVYIRTDSGRRYYRLRDYAVQSSLSGPCLHLVPRFQADPPTNPDYDRGNVGNIIGPTNPAGGAA